MTPTENYALIQSFNQPDALYVVEKNFRQNIHPYGKILLDCLNFGFKLKAVFQKGVRHEHYVIRVDDKEHGMEWAKKVIDQLAEKIGYLGAITGIVITREVTFDQKLNVTTTKTDATIWRGGKYTIFKLVDQKENAVMDILSSNGVELYSDLLRRRLNTDFLNGDLEN